MGKVKKNRTRTVLVLELFLFTQTCSWSWFCSNISGLDIGLGLAQIYQVLLILIFTHFVILHLNSQFLNKNQDYIYCWSPDSYTI